MKTMQTDRIWQSVDSFGQPTASGTYLVTLHYPTGSRLVDVAFFDGAQWWGTHSDVSSVIDSMVVAWADVPQPY